MPELIEAKQSIMVYEDDEGESTAILFDKVDDHWQDPRPLSVDDMKELINEEIAVPYPLPTNMLWYQKDRCMIWICKGKQRSIIIEEKCKLYKHPTLAFKVTQKDDMINLSVAVLPLNFSRETFIDTKLLELPYSSFDVHKGTTHLGACNVVIPNSDFAFSLEWCCWEEWERAFFNSGFNEQPKRRNHLKQTDVTLMEWMKDND